MEEKNNTGIVFENGYKKNDNQPDFRGTGNFEGKKFDLALWYRQTKEGKDYFSISFQEPYKKDEEEKGDKLSWKDRKQKIEPNGVIEPLEKDEEDLPF